MSDFVCIKAEGVPSRSKELKDFFEYAHNLGYKWKSGNSLLVFPKTFLSFSYFTFHNDKTVFRCSSPFRYAKFILLNKNSIGDVKKLLQESVEEKLKFEVIKKIEKEIYNIKIEKEI